jgi:hypothetical protein
VNGDKTPRERPQYAGPGMCVDDHRGFGPSRPADEASGPAGALHGLVTLVLLVVAMWPAGAHCSAGGVDDATAPMGAPQARRLAAVQITFGEQWDDHARQGKHMPRRAATTSRTHA